MSDASLVIMVPGFAPPGWSLRWRVGVSDHWAAPGMPFAVPPGATDVAIEVEATAPQTWIAATARLRIDVPPAGVTRVAIPPRTIRDIFTPRPR
jgi:hypothetical protein